MPDPAQPTPEPHAWLVDVAERSNYVVRIDGTALGLPADVPYSSVTELLGQLADMMVADHHPDAVRTYVEREIGDTTPIGQEPDTSTGPGEPVEQVQYTHWAYFPTAEDAKACAAELRQTFTAQTRIEIAEAPTSPDEQWLLRAVASLPRTGMSIRHNEVEAVVTRHHGSYDSGEFGTFDVETGAYITPPTQPDDTAPTQ